MLSLTTIVAPISLHLLSLKNGAAFRASTGTQPTRPSVGGAASWESSIVTGAIATALCIAIGLEANGPLSSLDISLNSIDEEQLAPLRRLCSSKSISLDDEPQEEEEGGY